MISRELYTTSTDSSFLQAFGPYRVLTSSDIFEGVFFSDMEQATYVIEVGELSFHGEEEVEKLEED